ncbi:hypothetical protein GWI33_003869 [Rhynchophorus ferrugineus]|uniref:Reverse transcriptase domain-containing protein n=1 Tax=Rhynchophorus ferrugineus TaxID=354439 RepID=A0A834J2W3_RHYFE|nr:hypothetical protein GWI33_003869 [Rhynchophorus ferrugineus]
MSKFLPRNYCQLLESYLFERQFRVSHEMAFSRFKTISAGVPQGNVLGPLLYLLYTADIPTTKDILLGTFANDTIITAKDISLPRAIEKVKVAVHKIYKWTKNWKIQLNSSKSVHVNFALRRNNKNLIISLNGWPIPQAKSAKYLGIHLNYRLN